MYDETFWYCAKKKSKIFATIDERLNASIDFATIVTRVKKIINIYVGITIQIFIKKI